MKFIYIIVLIYVFWRSLKYGKYEIEVNKNKPAGISIFFLTFMRANISINFIAF